MADYSDHPIARAVRARIAAPGPAPSGATLERRGVRALNPAMGFPLEVDHFPGKTWVVSHKPVAVAAGLGRMGIHRNVIHPRFGSFILLATILMDAEVTEYSRPLDYNPCL